MDVAKSAAAVASNGGHIRDYEDGARPVTQPHPPLMFVPTTSGTGSEAVGGTIITDTSRQFKMHIVAVPGHVALCDPLLTLSLPPAVTAATGLDALSHAIGAYVSVERQPLADAYALYAIELVSQWLMRAVTQGQDREARAWMMVASLTAGISMKGGGSGEHAFAHGINVLHRVHHGVGCAVFLADVMDYNLPQCADRYARIGQAMGVQASGGTEERARAGIAAVRSLIKTAGIPTLRELGVGEKHVPRLVDYVMQDAFHLGLNPVPITAGDAEKILWTTLQG
jgi:alcohol dehydrogenase class IV